MDNYSLTSFSKSVTVRKNEPQVSRIDFLDRVFGRARFGPYRMASPVNTVAKDPARKDKNRHLPWYGTISAENLRLSSIKLEKKIALRRRKIAPAARFKS